VKHPRIDSVKLAQRLKRAAGASSVLEIAKKSKVDSSRVSRFLNGDFKKLTPVLSKVCESLEIRPGDYLLDGSASGVIPEIFDTLNRIVGRDPRKILAAARLLRSLEALTRNASRPPS
jgi:DNA-binding Xre family transcriptional regulator